MLVAAFSGASAVSESCLPTEMNPAAEMDEINTKRGWGSETSARLSNLQAPRMLGSNDCRLKLKLTCQAFYINDELVERLFG